MNESTQKSNKTFLIVGGVICFLLVVGLCIYLMPRGGDSPISRGANSDTHKSLMTSSISVVEKVNGVLAGITDKATAEAASVQLGELNEELQALSTKADQLGEPSDQEQAALESLPGYQDAMAKLKEQFLRLTDDAEALEVVMKALPELDN